MSEQLAQWMGEFGVSYTDRNRPRWEDLVPAWKQMLASLPESPSSILEVGCNLGHNLQALQSIFPEARVRGVEPQTYARGYAEGIGLEVYNGHLPAAIQPKLQSDLVITSGVLIHLAPRTLHPAMKTLHAASERWLVAVEYFNEVDAEVEYRGMQRQLWVRDYGAHYQRLFPGLKLLDSGEVTEGGGFDRCNFWVFEK